jgi:hypothetical protein
MLLTEDEDVVDELSSRRACEPLGERVHVGSSYRGADQSRADRLERGRERASELCVAIVDE